MILHEANARARSFFGDTDYRMTSFSVDTTVALSGDVLYYTADCTFVRRDVPAMPDWDNRPNKSTSEHGWRRRHGDG